MPEDTMRTAEVAALFSVHPATVHEWASTGKLAAFRTPGGQFRFRRQDVEAKLVPVSTDPERASA